MTSSKPNPKCILHLGWKNSEKVKTFDDLKWSRIKQCDEHRNHYTRNQSFSAFAYLTPLMTPLVIIPNATKILQLLQSLLIFLPHQHHQLDNYVNTLHNLMYSAPVEKEYLLPDVYSAHLRPGIIKASWNYWDLAWQNLQKK